LKRVRLMTLDPIVDEAVDTAADDDERDDIALAIVQRTNTTAGCQLVQHFLC